MLGYLLLYRWACEGRRVVVLKRTSSSTRTPVLLCKDGAFRLDTVSMEEELADPDVRYVSHHL